jgi:hypothetical protein
MREQETAYGVGLEKASMGGSCRQDVPVEGLWKSLGATAFPAPAHHVFSPVWTVRELRARLAGAGGGGPWILERTGLFLAGTGGLTIPTCVPVSATSNCGAGWFGNRWGDFVELTARILPLMGGCVWVAEEYSFL